MLPMVGYWLVTKAAPTIKEKTKQTGITSTKNCPNTKGSFSCIRRQGWQGSAKDDCCVFCFLACLHITQKKEGKKASFSQTRWHKVHYKVANTTLLFPQESNHDLTHTT